MQEITHKCTYNNGLPALTINTCPSSTPRLTHQTT